MSAATPSVEALLNVSVDSLAKHVGVVDDGQGEVPDSSRSRLLKMQLGILQRQPREQQAPIHQSQAPSDSELAAKYLPDLVQLFRSNSGVLSAPMTLLNVISYTPYFVRFLRSPAGQGIAALQTKRTAESAAEIDGMNAGEVAEITQFLATILLLQTTSEVDEADKKILVKKLRQWAHIFPNSLALDTCERCLGLLTDDPSTRQMMRGAKQFMERGLVRCGGGHCTRTVQNNGADLLQCARIDRSRVSLSRVAKCVREGIAPRCENGTELDKRCWEVKNHGQLVDLEVILSPRLFFPVPLIFQQVEEESERRAQEELETQKLTREALQQKDTDATIKQIKSRRRGSVSISRIGQLVEESLPSPNRLTKIASNSPFYQAQIANASDNSIASGASAFSDDNAHAEDQTQVTQMHRIAGREGLTKIIPRKLSRAHSAVIPSTADGSMVIGVSVQEATCSCAREYSAPDIANDDIWSDTSNKHLG
ncbi:hypothetical protein K443DRAFT_130203 [Laccaria amethystina LaAM-08-1]|uniref:Uncharacterized protein n=1 Tax=Laccaria amethystina LaAM-08-1 TaxID=1095629 RepID=A0A0C9X100_9AGAR|nr:hypothetical protein K443DRAFT_130203 [Laccaria amethystina LaAM-08-1]